MAQVGTCRQHQAVQFGKYPHKTANGVPVHLDFLDASGKLCTLIEVDQFHARTTPVLVAILNECEIGLVQTKIRNARRLKTLQI
jgi:hypothetical protein